MTRILLLLALLLAPLALAAPAQAEPADIDAAARGVVRIVIFEKSGDDLYPLSHGTGFAVSSKMIVTNAHVVAEALNGGEFEGDRVIGIVPPEGDSPAFARIVKINQGTDLALLAIEGERDDISGLGQTKAALELTPRLDASKKRYYMAEGAGHYGIFNGSRWREKIAPVVEEFIAAHG